MRHVNPSTGRPAPYGPASAQHSATIGARVPERLPSLTAATAEH